MPDDAPPTREAGSDLELTLGGDAPTAAAGAAVQALAAGVGVSAERSTRLRALVEQLVLESRSRECVDGSAEVVVRTGHGPGRLRVHVADRRLPVRPAESRHAPSRRMVALGFADRLHVGDGGPHGNVATCEVAIDDESATGPAGEHGDAPAPAVADEVERASDEQAASLEVRAMGPEDAAGLVRCVYRCYGYSYLDPLLYRPRQLRRALRSGTLRSVVAVEPGGEVVGHSALTFDRPGDPVPEAGKLVVDPRYRGHHVAERLATVRKERARTDGLVGYWSECVTNHPFSQRQVIATGGAETGLLIGAVPASLTMQGLTNHEGRHTLLTMYVALGSRPARVHVPDRHAALLIGVATAVGLDREVVVAADRATGSTSLVVEVAVDAGTAHLRVHRPGADLVDRVADEVEALRHFELGAVHLDLPLSDPATATAATDLERLGFCWGAWVPCFARDGGDVLRLQRTGDHAVDVDGVACARAEGEAVRDHVVAEWRRVQRGGDGLDRGPVRAPTVP